MLWWARSGFLYCLLRPLFRASPISLPRPTLPFLLLPPQDVFEKHGEVFEEIGANPNNGFGAVLEAIDNKLPANKAKEIRADIDACYEERPWLAMVNSDKGITNLVRASRRVRSARALVQWTLIHPSSHPTL